MTREEQELNVCRGRDVFCPWPLITKYHLISRLKSVMGFNFAAQGILCLFSGIELPFQTTMEIKKRKDES